MRSLRWLLLVAILVIVAGVAVVYRTQRALNNAARRPAPPLIALDTKSTADDFGMCGPGWCVNAKDVKESAAGDKKSLTDVELKLNNPDGKHYDLVRMPHAEFTTGESSLFAPDSAQITLDVPLTGEMPPALTSITTTGIHYDTVTGFATTDQHAAFTFEGGDGTSNGATYDPKSHQIQLRNGVVLNLRGKDAGSRTMKVETDSLLYKATDSKVTTGPWTRLTDAGTVLNGGDATITIVNRKLNAIDTTGAHGITNDPGRELEYSADTLHAQYGDDQTLQSLAATGKTRLVSHSKGLDTTVTGNKLDIAFTPEMVAAKKGTGTDKTGKDKEEKKQSVLTSAITRGNGFLESKPAAPDAKGNTTDTRTIRSENIDLKMKADGKEIDRVNVPTPGTLEFLPNQPSHHRRVLKADRMLIVYGANNELQSFHADNASTESHPSDEDRAKTPKPATEIAYTTSKTLDASFDEKGALSQMKQSGNFRYTEGVRKAQSDNATMDYAHNVMDLDSHARVADDTGSTAADHIRLDQATDEFEARGKVLTTRLADQKDKTPGMLDSGEPTQGQADRVVSAKHGHVMQYIGNAVVRQAASRIKADRIDIDRDKKTLAAEGQVESQLQDNGSSSSSGPASAPSSAPAKSAKAAPSVPVFTIVKAPHLTYSDTDRLAVYSGGVELVRSTLKVTSSALKVWTNDGKADSRVDHAFADGKVETLQIARDGKHTGSSEHMEYYTEGGKIILTGGQPQMIEPTRTVKGNQITYSTDGEHLVVDGVPQAPVKTSVIGGIKK